MATDGYSYWSGKPVTPGSHEIFLVPQSVIDGWSAYCSCGQWQAFADFWDHPKKDDLLAKLTLDHQAHQQAEHLLTTKKG